jgi:folate-dependent phosphoribosylglycinamide formyltransferase PurN
MTAAVDRPIRIVYFAGPYLEPSAVRFVTMLDEHPEIEFVLGLCQGEGAGLSHRLRNLWRRRGWMALPVMGIELAQGAGRFVRDPCATLDLRRRAAPVLARFVTVPDVHAPEVLERVRAMAPDLGVVYGGPILKPSLFSLPRLGTLGIHHGRAPEYRGKKTTFWEMYNGERTAGVTIQRLNPGIDTGDILRRGAVEIGRKGYSRVWREVEAVGRQVFLEAILDVRRGEAQYLPQDARSPRRPLYKQPSPREIVRLWLRRWLGRPAAEQRGDP